MEKSENLREDEDESENNNSETGASTEAIYIARDVGKQDAVVKEETDVNTADIAEQHGDANIKSIQHRET